MSEETPKKRPYGRRAKKTGARGDHSRQKGTQGALPKKYRDFAHLIISGSTQADAYKQAISPTAQWSTCTVHGNIIAQKPKVQAYIKRLREESWTANVLSLAEKRSYLADVVRTPVGQVDENSPLAQEVIYEESEKGSRKKIKMVSKAQAIELDSKLAGDMYSDRQGNNGNPFGWLVVMHKANQQDEPKAIEIGNTVIAEG